MYDYNELYSLFNNELIKEIKIDWFHAQDLYFNIGNAPGMYPDTLLLLLKIIDQYNVKKIIELGSGFSTLYISKICKEKDIKFKSYEEDKKWLEKTKELLNHYNLNNDHIVNLVNFNDIDYDTDLILIDCNNESRSKILESNKLNIVPIVIVDDVNRLELSISCSKFMCNSKRYSFYIYNGVGRRDRLLFINFLSQTVDINKLMENIPCIGG